MLVNSQYSTLNCVRMQASDDEINKNFNEEIINADKNKSYEIL